MMLPRKDRARIIEDEVTLDTTKAPHHGMVFVGNLGLVSYRIEERFGERYLVDRAHMPS